jgi:hypothetical protein
MNLMTAVSKNADFETDRIGISYMLAGDDNVNAMLILSTQSLIKARCGFRKALT